MARKFLNKLKINDLASSTIILILLALLLHATQLFSRMDNVIYDLGQRVSSIAAPDDVIIIAIDEESLAKIGRWPWSRQVHADLLKRLYVEKPAVIGFDVVFAEPDLANPSADAALGAAIQAAGNVVLPVLLETTRTNGQIKETLPLPALIDHAADLGRVHAALDQDSIARSVYLFEGVGTPAWQLFSQAVNNVAEHQASKNNFKQDNIGSDQSRYTLARGAQRRVNFIGPPGYFYRISYAQVLSGEFEKGLFNHKVVLVGATALGLGDFLTTPVSGLTQPMPGVEFHANVLESIRSERLIKEAPFWLSTMLVMLFSTLPLLWLPKLRALSGLLVTMLLMVLLALGAAVLPHVGIWFPPSAALAAILLAYPIWSWRKLEAAQRFLDEELRYLKEHLLHSPKLESSKKETHFDEFDARIAQVRAASDQLRFLQSDRKETLAFISHDLRAPLASALNTLQQHPTLSAKLHKPLSQALELAEDFLQASRAEMMDKANFVELDFAGLVHQAVDAAYEAATKKEIVLEREIFEGVVWLQGNFGLLERAILNLILNAVKYSPTQSKILIRLSLDAHQTEAILSVTDHGPGIPTAQQAQLFKRFSRVKGQEQLAEGAGLGLYFVRTVAEKHQGSISMMSEPDQPTTFSMRLPMISAQLEEY